MSGTIGTLLLPFAAGVDLVGPIGGVLTVALLASAAVGVAEWLTGTDEDGDESAAGQDLAALERALPGLPVQALAEEWRSSAARLGPDVDPRVRAGTAQARALILDELVRRDPAGAARWLRTGGDDPEEHLGGAGCPA